MPRSARIIVPNVPHHIVQRGHNRSSVFAEPADFNYYLQTLREWKTTLGVKVYGYCLMTNHVHLILEPSDDARVVEFSSQSQGHGDWLAFRFYFMPIDGSLL
jgi:REP element-mobilizing transposase RayT